MAGMNRGVLEGIHQGWFKGGISSFHAGHQQVFFKVSARTKNNIAAARLSTGQPSPQACGRAPPGNGNTPDSVRDVRRKEVEDPQAFRSAKTKKG